MKAHDGDRGINNAIKFSLSKSDHDFFDINESTGVVFTTTELDRERSLNDENGAYILEIIASEISDTLVRSSIYFFKYRLYSEFKIVIFKEKYYRSED